MTSRVRWFCSTSPSSPAAAAAAALVAWVTKGGEGSCRDRVRESFRAASCCWSSPRFWALWWRLLGWDRRV
uniref:Putative secreted protein n=1 Tax=Anopheles marajoara TaxID=58244 RepID=A0A2M4CE69_9DIPT